MRRAAMEANRRVSLRSAVLAAGSIAALALFSQPASAHDNVVVHRKLAEWSVSSLNNPFFFPYAPDVREGSYGEDVPATRSLGHFYNPQTDAAPWFALGSGPAWQNSEDQYDAGVGAYQAGSYSGEDAAFYRMGRALHFIQDMTSPAHTHDDQHATDDEDFENWGPANVNSFDFSSVTPKLAAVRTAAGFVRELSRLVYDKTAYQADIDENTATQVSSEFKAMFPSLHWVDGGFWGDDVWEVDRIGSFDCFGNGTLCNDGWWMLDETLTDDNSGRGGSRRVRGYAYIENTGGNGGPVVPTIFKGVPNTSGESMLQIYGRVLYPEAVAYGAGLLRVFAEAGGAPPTRTATPTWTATNPPSVTATRTSTVAPVPPTSTVTVPPTWTATNPPTVTPVPPTVTVTAAPTWTATNPPSVTATKTPTVTPVAPTSTPTPTATASGLCAETPRVCGLPALSRKAIVSLTDKSDDRRDSLKWKWSNGEILPTEIGDPVGGGTDYAICVYDEVANTAVLAMSVQAAGGSKCRWGFSCWSSRRDGFVYSDDDAAVDGLKSLTIRSSPDPKRGKITVKATGTTMPLLRGSTPNQLLTQQQRVRVQLVNSLGRCWEGVFSSPAARNDSQGFKDVSD